MANKSLKEVLPQLAAFLVIVSLFVFGSSFLARILTTNKEDIEKAVEAKVVEVIKEKKIVLTPPVCEKSAIGFEELKKKGQFLQLTTNKPSYGKGGFVSNIEPTVLISGSDDVACGYLYIRVSKSGKELERRYESIYINPQGFGGHILWDRSISVKDGKSFTEALVPLDTVSYLPGLPFKPEAKNYRIADWSKLLNVNSHVKFSLGLSTPDVGGKIEEVSIAYKCWNSTTGEESTDCQLSVE